MALDLENRTGGFDPADVDDVLEEKRVRNLAALNLVEIESLLPQDEKLLLPWLDEVFALLDLGNALFDHSNAPLAVNIGVLATERKRDGRTGIGGRSRALNGRADGQPRQVRLDARRWRQVQARSVCWRARRRARVHELPGGVDAERFGTWLVADIAPTGNRTALETQCCGYCLPVLCSHCDDGCI